MNWQLPNTNHPAYLRVIHLITAAIESGELLPDTRLPAERELARLLGVNRSTIGRALAELQSQGLLARRVGRGTWVNADKWGVSTPVAWHDYLETNRLGGPDPFSVRLARLRKAPDAIDLADSTIAADLAVPLTPSGLSLAALYAAEEDMDITGALPLKKAVIARLGQQLAPESVLITSGAQQAYYLLSQGLLAEGDAIAVEAPSYFYQLTLFQAAGIRVYGVPLSHGQLDLAALADVYHQHHVRFLFVNPTGQNPTGATMPLAARKALLAQCRALHLPVVEDDLLALVADKSVPSLRELDPQNVLAIGSLSPLMGPHTRIGWLIAPPGVVLRLAQIRQQMEAEISAFPQQLATQLLTQVDLPAAIATQRCALLRRQQALEAALAPFVATGQLQFSPPGANNHLWVQLNCSRKLAAGDYQAFLHAHVLVRPDLLFGARGNRVRLSFARFDPTQQAALTARMAAILRQLAI